MDSPHPEFSLALIHLSTTSRPGSVLEDMCLDQMLARILDLNFSCFPTLNTTAIDSDGTAYVLRHNFAPSVHHFAVVNTGFLSLSLVLFYTNTIPTLSRHIHPVSGTIACSIFLIFIISIAYILIYMRLCTHSSRRLKLVYRRRPLRTICAIPRSSIEHSRLSVHCFIVDVSTYHFGILMLLT